jgi:transposase
MPKTLDFRLSPADLRRITIARKSAPLEVLRRALIVRFLHDGYAPKEVAEIFSVSQPTVYAWYHRWQRRGLAGLATRPKPGRPIKADNNYIQLLKEVVQQDPQDLGYPFNIWTAERLRLHLKSKTGIELKRTRFRLLLKENGFVCDHSQYRWTHSPEAEMWRQMLKGGPIKIRLTFSNVRMKLPRLPDPGSR